ncbi:hypothetical protein D3C76_1645710 [compost metagenome]
MLLKTLDGFTPVSMLHRAVDKIDPVTTIAVSQGFSEIVLGCAVFGKYQYLLVRIGSVDFADNIFDEQLQF